MSERVDVAVVGGGPAGALTAAAAAGGGRTVLLERAPNRPARCAGLIGVRGRELLSVPQEHILAEIRRLRVRGPDDVKLELVSSVPKGFVVDRAALDRLLVERARQAGAEVRLGVAAVGWEPGRLFTTAGRLDAPVVVGADGPCSDVAHWAGLGRPLEPLVGIQVALEEEGPADCAEVIFGGVIPQGSFAWSIPGAEGCRSVGLATDHGREAALILSRVLSEHFSGARVIRKVAGLIPVGPPRMTVGEGVVLVGDAAGQVKPWSGGGLYYGALCARLAGETAAAGPEHVHEYERRWRERLGEEIEFGLAARRLMKRLSEHEAMRVVRALGSTRLAAFLAREGDIDHPAGVLRDMLSCPALWGEGLSLVSALGGWSRVRQLLSGLRVPPDKA